MVGNIVIIGGLFLNLAGSYKLFKVGIVGYYDNGSGCIQANVPDEKDYKKNLKCGLFYLIAGFGVQIIGTFINIIL